MRTGSSSFTKPARDVKDVELGKSGGGDGDGGAIEGGGSEDGSGGGNR